MTPAQGLLLLGVLLALSCGMMWFGAREGEW